MSIGNQRDIRNLVPGRVYVAPSIFCSDLSKVGDEVEKVSQAGADLLHLDIMDGHFVPNFSLGPAIVKACRSKSDLAFDVHLMLTDPGKYIDVFKEAGADHITLHVESNGDLHQLIKHIHDGGMTAGLTLRPGTPVETLLPYLEEVELILVMTVEPGFGGQSFMADQMPKFEFLRREIDKRGLKILLEVDGGVNAKTSLVARAAGAEVLVAGNSVFKSPDYAAAISSLRQ